MKISERFAGKFFKAADLTREGTVMEIYGVEDVTLRGEEKVILHFVDEDRMFPVNKTNALAMAEYLGDDTDDWAGKEVCLFRSNTTYQGKPIGCVRCRNPELSADDVDENDDIETGDLDTGDDAASPANGNGTKGKPMGKGMGMSKSMSKTSGAGGKGKPGKSKPAARR